MGMISGNGHMYIYIIYVFHTGTATCRPVSFLQLLSGPRFTLDIRVSFAINKHINTAYYCIVYFLRASMKCTYSILLLNHGCM